MRLVNRPLAEIQNKTSELARDAIEGMFSNWFVYSKNSKTFTRIPVIRYANNDANISMGYCAAEKAVWIAASGPNVTARDLLLVWQLTLIEHQMSLRIDSILNQCYKQLDEIEIRDGDAVKFDKDKHKQSWRVQKGCLVSWVDGSKHHWGIVKQVISAAGLYGKEPHQVVVDTGNNSTVTVDVDKIRISKTPNTIRKDQHKGL